MKAKEKGEEGEVSVPPSNGNSSTKQEKSFSESDLPSDSESSRVLEDTASQSSKSEPKRSVTAAPLTELALLNESIFVPPVARQAAENRHEGGAAEGFNKTLATACLSFNQVHQIPTSAKPEPPSTRAARRPRGRPRKNSVTAVSDSEKRTVVEDASKSVSESETSILVKERQSEIVALEVTKRRAKDSPRLVRDKRAPVGRPRGRPAKTKVQAGSSPSKSSEDSPVRRGRGFKSPDAKARKPTASLGNIGTSRPLTRGALGKDFPSAKKRSWIDVEKELEPELESE